MSFGIQTGQPRFAAASDSEQISRLFEVSHRPTSGGSARDNYPFPQFLQPGWVREAVESGRSRWVVWENQGQVVGSAAALPNVGSPLDKVAEIFGIASCL
jgi:hypothetical protein